MYGSNIARNTDHVMSKAGELVEISSIRDLGNLLHAFGGTGQVEFQVVSQTFRRQFCPRSDCCAAKSLVLAIRYLPLILVRYRIEGLTFAEQDLHVGYGLSLY